MNSIVILCLTLTIAGSFFAILYLIPYFSKKKIHKGKFDVLQFLNLFFSPILVIPIFYFFKQIIDLNPYTSTIIFPKNLSELVFLILLYFLILGNGIHAVSVVLSKHMKSLRKHPVWEINEFFHQEFSHFLLTASAVLIFFSFAIYEINRPSPILLNYTEIIILIISGLIAGVIIALASVEGRIPQNMFFILYLLSLILPFIFFKFNLNYKQFPFTTFVETMFISAIINISLYKYKKEGFPEIVPYHFFDD